MSWKWPFERSYDIHGGYYLYAIVTIRDGKEEVWKTHIRSDKVMRLEDTDVGEQAMALHRVVRAMHDGHCPK